MFNKKIIVATVFLLTVGFVVSSVNAVKSAVPSMGGINGSPKVIVDAGHGGFDGGAVGKGNVFEKDINLSVSLKLRNVLTALGCQVIMTRETDEATDDKNKKTIHSRKVSDIHNRIDLIKQNPDAIVISIHQNKFPQSKYWGAQVFYGVKQKEPSEQLAQILQDNIRQYIQPENSRKIKEGYKTIYLLQNSPNTTVMVECGFISNETEFANLCNPEYQSKLAVVIATSLLDYLKSA